jgi:perosamine synthetase
MIPLSVPVIEGNEWRYVKECLDSGWVSSAGAFVERFETEIARVTGARHAIACVTGTAALHVGLQVAGVEAGDEVLVPTVTFIATVNAVRYVGAHPIFFDCDEFYNLDVDAVLRFLTEETSQQNGRCVNTRTGRRVAAILPVHVFGNAVRLDALVPFCRARNIRIVEDAAESLGTVYRGGPFDGRHTGTVGEIGCLSFNGNKIITTGGGGMVLTDDDALARAARYLTTQAKDDEVRFVHHEVGYNYRLTNLQAAVGVAQLEQLPKYLDAKRRNFEAYERPVIGIRGLHLAPAPSYASNNHWMYALQIDPDTYGLDREGLMATLDRHRIQTRPLWHLNHLQTPYRMCQTYGISRAARMLETTLTLPCSVNLTSDQIDRVVDVLERRA